jgi:hypothetical protein
VRELPRARDEQLRGARNDVRLEAAAAHRTDRAAIGAHDHARSGAPIRRAVDVDDGGQQRGLAAPRRFGECEANAIQFVHE